MPEKPSPRSATIVVPILGMHRSGTSMFTRALQLLGMELGEGLMPPQPDNPKGFWENEFFWSANVQILRDLNCQMSGYGKGDSLLRLPELSGAVERSDDNLATIESFIDRTFSAPVWGWKDPRTVLLFPFWLGVLVDLGFRQIRPTIIARHPGACVRSLTRRQDLPQMAAALGLQAPDLALDMWKAYSRILLAIGDETDCFIGLHEWLMAPDRVEDELRRCAAYSGLGEGVDLSPALEWIDPAAVHQTDDGDRDTDPESLSLYREFEARATSQRAVWARRAAPHLISLPQASVT